MSPERLEQRRAVTTRLNEIRKVLSRAHFLDDFGFTLMSKEAARLEAELRRKEGEA
ncbi:hypothetical protein [Paenibacillus sp. MDMC362]|uniref:hypothetical protein n=1 Tax=Paenibacillus sp. MDMC362 TaxID=2977365 RepID=UPI0015EB6EEE|nr:hypothetical protein [Paenibacillus sp. MDMC362]